MSQINPSSTDLLFCQGFCFVLLFLLRQQKWIWNSDGLLPLGMIGAQVSWGAWRSCLDPESWRWSRLERQISKSHLMQESSLCLGSGQILEKTKAWWMLCGCMRHPGGVTKYFVSSQVRFKSCAADSGCREWKSLVLWLWWILLFEKKAKNYHCLWVIRLSSHG